MTRLVAASLLLTVWLFAIIAGQVLATEAPQLQDFDRDACYSKCPCTVGGMGQACADCKQRCDDKYWKSFDERSKKMKKN